MCRCMASRVRATAWRIIFLLFLLAATGLFGWRLGSLQESKDPGRIAGSDGGLAGLEYSHRLQTPSYVGGVLFAAVEPGGVVSSHEWCGVRTRNLSQVLYDADGKKWRRTG